MRPAALLLMLLATAPLLAGCFEPANNAWAADLTQIDGLRDEGATGRGVRIAVLDSGIDLGHPSLAHLGDGRRGNGEVVAYADFVGDSRRATDDGGHGTYVAGVLAADPPAGLASVTDAGSAVRGLAPDVALIVGRVCETGMCRLEDVLAGVQWALTQDADIVSLSLGYATADLNGHDELVADLRATLAQAEELGVLVVAAAGNTEGGPVLFPAREPTVVAVGAMDRDGTVRGTSARGFGSQKPDLLAPGEGIVGPDRGNGRVRHDGTSAAVPFVVAAAALILSESEPPADAAGVARLRQALRDSAAPLDGQARPHDPRAGHGLVQAEAALGLYRSLAAAATAPTSAGTGRR